MQVQQNISPTFRAGLTSNIRQQIVRADVEKISAEFAKNNIQADFKGNKTIAWCSLKALEILKSLKLGLPKGVFVEDFEKLNADDCAYGFCNILPANIYRGNKKITEEKTIFFNSAFDWKNVDEMSDMNFEEGNSPTNFFLDTVLHEFAHAAHETQLLEKLDISKLQRLITVLSCQNNLHKFRLKYQDILRTICSYALENPFEAVACDFAKRVINNMDTNTLVVNSQIKQSNPYKWRSIFKSPSEDNLEETMRQFWRGRFFD